MQIARNTVVSIDYTLTDDEGTVLDSSTGREPLTYLHGAGTIIPGLENALEGQETGDELQVKIAPTDGYGERQDGLLAEVARSHFQEIDDLEVGMRFRVPTDQGDFRIVTVVGVADETVTIDGNHPLAGMTLNFDVTVREVRSATTEEVDGGRVI